MSEIKNKTTIVQSLINSVKYMNMHGIVLTANGLLTMLENSIQDEKEMIIDVWDSGYAEGIKKDTDVSKSTVFHVDLYYEEKYKNKFGLE
jgi:hypothetical protein